MVIYYLLLHFLIFTIFGFVANPDSFGQSFLVRDKSLVLSVQFDGSSKLTRASGQKLDLPLLDLLELENVQNELELIERQSKNLREYLEDYRQRKKEILIAWIKVRDIAVDDENEGFKKKRVAEFEAKFLSFRKEYKKKGNDFLLPHQQQRLKEIQRRAILKKKGLQILVEKGGSPDLIDLKSSLTNGQKREFKAWANKEGKKIQESAKEICKQYVEQTLESLTPQELRKIKSIMGDEFNLPRTDLEVFYWQLSHRKKNYLNAPRTTLEALGRIPALSLADDGTFDDPISKKQSSAIAMTIRGIGMLKDLQRPLELTESQISSLEDNYQRCRQRNKTLMREYQERIKTTSLEEARKWVTPKQENIWKQGVTGAEGILLPHQKKMLDEFMVKVEYLRDGIVYSLLDGKLGKKIDLSKASRKKLEATAGKVQKQIVQDTLKIENRVYKKLGEFMSSEAKREFEKLIGDPLEHTIANLSVLALDLKGHLTGLHFR